MIFEFYFQKISISENRFQRLPFADEFISLSPLSPHLLLFFAALPLCVFVSISFRSNVEVAGLRMMKHERADACFRIHHESIG